MKRFIKWLAKTFPRSKNGQNPPLERNFKYPKPPQSFKSKPKA